MAITEDLLVKIESDISDIDKDLKRLEGRFESLDDNTKSVAENTALLKGSFSRAAVAITGLNQAVQLGAAAFRALVGPVQAVTRAYSVQEAAETNLTNALRLTGQFTRETLEDLKDFASELQAVTTVGDETSLRLLQVATSMNLTADQAKDLVQASADLSSATGRDLDSSFNQLLKTFGGFAGELGEVLPAVKELTSEQLKAGEAVDAIRRQFAGFASSEAQTFRGSLEQVSNALGDVFEDLGKTIVDVFRIPDAAKELKLFLETLGQTIRNDVRPTLEALRDAAQNIDFEKLAEDFKLFGAALLALASPAILATLSGIFTVLLNFTGVTVAIVAAAGAVDILVKNFDRLDQVGVATGNALVAIFERLKIVFQGVTVFILEQAERLVSALQGTFLDVGGAASTAIESIRSAQASLNMSILETADSLSIVDEMLEESTQGLDLGFLGSIFEQGKKFVDDFNQSLVMTSMRSQEAADNLSNINEKAEQLNLPAAGQVDLFGDQQIGLIRGAFGDGAAIAAKELSGVLQGPLGFVGAANTVLQAIQGLINAIPQLLDQVSGIFNSLASLPQDIATGFDNAVGSLRNFVDNFLPNLVESIPEILNTLIDGLIDGISQALVSLAQRLPDIIIDVLDRLPEITVRLTEALVPAFIRISTILPIELAKRAPEIGVALSIAFVRALSGVDLARGLIRGFETGFNELFDSLTDRLDFTEGLNEQLDKLSSTFTNVSDQIFNVIDIQAEARGLTQAQRIGDIIERGIIRFGNIFDGLIKGLLNAWRDIVDNILQPAFDFLRNIWLGIFDTVLKPFINLLDGTFQIFKNIGQAVVDSFLMAFDRFTELGQNVVDTFLLAFDSFKGVGQNIVDSFLGVFDRFRTIGQDVIDGLFGFLNSFREAIQNLLSFDIGGALGGGGGLGSLLSTGLGSVAGGAVAGPVGAVAGAIGGGFGGGFAKGGFVGGPGLPKAIASAMNVARFQNGGSTDTVPALLTPGEFVVNRNAANQLGSSFLNQINRGSVPGSTIVNQTINVSIQTQAQLDENFVRQRLIPTVKNAIKDSTRRGELLVNTRGVYT